MKTKTQSFLFSLFLLALTIGISSCEPKEDITGAIIEITENISEDIVWESGNVYVIKGTIRISSNLTIEPGTTVKFMEDATIEFAYWDEEYVTVTAKGTEKDPIIFTSNSSTPAPGNYNGLRFYNGANNCVFEHCTFEFGGKSDYYGTIYIEEASVSFTNCQFRNLKNNGIVLKEEGSFAQFSNNTFADINKNSIYIMPKNVHTIGENNIFDNASNYGILISGDQNFDTGGNYTWLAHNTPYIIEDDIRMGSEGSGVNITINPGTTIKFAKEAYLEFAYWENQNAKIIAKGTADKPILFTSNSPAPAAGDYGGFRFYNGANNCEFEYCTFEFAGQADWTGSIYINNSSVKFLSCTFKDLKNSAIVLKEGGAFSLFEGNTFLNIEKHPIDILPNYAHTIGANNTFNANANRGIFISNDGILDIRGDYTWLNHDAPYIIEDMMRIGSEGSGVNLTIEPGTTVKFSDGAGFEISYFDNTYAKLIAEGTAANPIIFTSNSPAPAKGDWRGFVFNKGVSGSSLKHCKILYAGFNEYYGAFALLESGTNTVTLENSLIAHSNSHGITVYKSSIVYSTVTFTDNNGDDYKVL